MSIESLKTQRKVMRAAFTRKCKELEVLLGAKEPKECEIAALFLLVQQKYNDSVPLNQQINTHLLENEATEEELTTEMELCDQYTLTYNRMQVMCDKARDGSCAGGARDTSSVTSSSRRKFKLPQIEFVKFSGEVKDWMAFWGQFEKIHCATDIDSADKIQYLIQATVPNSKARAFVTSFPAVGDNYEDIVDGLRSRYGREELQIEIHIRELLKLILRNAEKRERVDVASLYDSIGAHLRALSTMGVATEKCAAILYPLIESCLPEGLLRTWHRSSECAASAQSAVGKEDTLKRHLDGLMDFLRREVENEQRIRMAQDGLGLNTDRGKKFTTFKEKPIETKPTATHLLERNEWIPACVFCDGRHESGACQRAVKMAYEEKKKILTEKGACYRCLRKGHVSAKCRVRVRCDECGRGHTNAMHSQVGSLKEEVVSTSTDNFVTHQALANSTAVGVFMQTLRVHLKNDGKDREVRVLLDGTDQRSYIMQSTAKEMGYKNMGSESFVHCLFGDQWTKEQRHDCHKVQLSSDGFEVTLDLLSQPKICSLVPPVSDGPWSSELDALGVKLTDVRNAGPIEVLLGADTIGKIWTSNHHVLKCDLLAIETKLGWTLLGKTPTTEMRRDCTMFVHSMLLSDSSLKNLWELDVLGIEDPAQKVSKDEAARAAMDLFLETVKVNEEGRYEVSLPWLVDHANLADNRVLAEGRLNNTMSRLRRDGIVEQYGEIFHEWIEEGIIEEVEEATPAVVTHYLPHRPVVKEESATFKIRPVFDASAREKGRPSLNQCLEKGVNLVELIPRILILFRLNEFGVVSDIRKAFLQISVRPSERDVLRFLWTDNGRLKVFRHRRVVFGVNCSLFLLGATIEYHLAKCGEKVESGSRLYGMETIERLRRSFYVDNCATSVSTIPDVHRFSEEAKLAMLEGKFDLRGWTYSGDDIGLDEVPVLGMVWHKKDDYLRLNGKCLPPVGDWEGPVTKRLMMSAVQKVFDPVGVVAPVLLIPKLMLQELWKKEIGWDVAVDETERRRFLEWWEQLRYLSELQIPRWIRGGPGRRYGLHVFCDASQGAYAVVIFLRAEFENDVHVSMVMAKARVAPLKKLTIPRLELMGATIAGRLYKVVRDCLPCGIECCFWTDSMTVLSWIQRSEEWAPFVGNRVREIRSLTDVTFWRHVPGALNPADLPSRGCSAKQLMEARWWEGPEWLRKPPDCWPSTKESCDEEEINAERKKQLVSTLVEVSPVADEMRLKYFSKFEMTVRKMGWMFRFIYNVRAESRRAGELTAFELGKAEKYVWRLVQGESFSGIEDPKVSQLSPFVDSDGLIRLKSRVGNRDDDEDFRYPIVLPEKHDLVERMLRDLHMSKGHVGATGLLGAARERYWVFCGRRAARSVTGRCVVCRRYASRRVETRVVPLPEDRVRDAAPFEIVGVDFAGPMYLRGGDKCWICIFTCAVYRAVHLELTQSLSSAAFIQVLRRYIARRGRPAKIYSDNGTNFVGVANLFKGLEWDQVQRYVSVKRINLYFNPPTASWWGGFWERLIGLVKRLLRKVLGRASLRYEELLTLVCECEGVMNDRPITYVTEDPVDMCALTPNMFLRELVTGDAPDCDLVERRFIGRRAAFQQKIRDCLRHRFRSEYLGQLKLLQNKRRERRLRCGELVLLGDDNKKRAEWPLARIVDLIEGKDGVVRLVRARTGRGVYLRPVQRVYPLECDGGESDGARRSLEVEVGGAGEASRTRSGRVVRRPLRYAQC